MVTQFFHTFAVPPQKPLIVDDRGRQVEGEVGIGPFREGESLSLECNVPGGKFKCAYTETFQIYPGRSERSERSHISLVACTWQFVKNGQKSC